MPTSDGDQTDRPNATLSPDRGRMVLAIAWLVVAVVGVGGGALSLALFSHTVPIAEPISAGTIVLDMTPSTTLVTMEAMVPGDQVAQLVTIRNDGSDALRYAMTSSASDPDGRHLAAALQVDIERRTGCAGAVLEVLYSGPVAMAAFGDPLPGGQGGDRPLASGSDETLCFRVRLPTDTDIQYADASTTLTLTFQAEQTAGNP